MDTVVLKFGGSSVADNIKLNVVAKKIIEIKQKTKNLVVVVSAQGKTTDKLIKEATELSAIPDERELDMLISTGEQITASKLSILLNRLGVPAISLTGWQAGIQTNNIHKNAKIEAIFPKRITDELEKGKIVIVAGFQGINEKQDITTLGRGGSDTTAVALQATINANKCIIFSDVDGIYSADPNIVKTAKKLDEISFDEMQVASDAGAKVLHNRCVQIGKKFDCNIVANSTFSNGNGTKICKKIENTEIKNIVKNDKILLIKTKSTNFDIYKELLNNNITIENFKNEHNIEFRINEIDKNTILKILEEKSIDYEIMSIIKLTLVGYCISQDNAILNIILNVLNEGNMHIYEININSSKIELILNKLDNVSLEKLHETLINREP